MALLDKVNYAGTATRFARCISSRLPKTLHLSNQRDDLYSSGDSLAFAPRGRSAQIDESASVCTG